MISIDLSKTPLGRGILIIIFVFVAIITPCWFLYQFANKIFVETELIKLIIISFAIGFPVLLLNAIIEILFRQYIDDNYNDTNTDIIGAINSGLISTSFIFYVPIVGAYFHINSLDEAIHTCITLQIVLVVMEVFRHKQNTKKRKIINKLEEKINDDALEGSVDHP